MGKKCFICNFHAMIVAVLLLTSTQLAAQLPLPLQNPDLKLLINGNVLAIVRQPDGGVVIGGGFTSINNVPRNHIARLLPGGELDPDWDPSPDGEVLALAVDPGGAVYAAGFFNSIGGQARTYIAKLSGTGTGEADANWNVPANDSVFDLAVDSSGAVYALGSFSSIGGFSRHQLARISGNGIGQVDPSWNPAVGGFVSAFALDGSDAVYIGGSFTSVGAELRNNLAKLSPGESGNVDLTWNPSANASIDALTVDGDNDVFVGGSFTSVGGQPRGGLAKVSGDGMGVADANWNPSPDGPIYVLTPDGNGKIYVGGAFTAIGGQPRSRVARLSASGSGIADADWNHPANDSVWAVSVDGSGTVHVGGFFSAMDDQARFGLATIPDSGPLGPAIDAEQSQPLVYCVARQANGGLIVGGDFLKVNDRHRANLFRLNADGTLDVDWNPGADDTVNILAVDSIDAVFAGGAFASIGGQSRAGLAKISGSGSGEIDAVWDPSPDNTILALAVDSEGAVYAGGGFSGIGGQSRANLAKLSGTGSGNADPIWNPMPNSSVLALAVGSDGSIYAGGMFDQIGGQLRNRIAKLSDTGDGSADLNWNPSANFLVDSLLIGESGEVYAGGIFTQIGGQPRNFIAKLSGSGTGAADPDWNPSPDNNVLGIAIDSSGSVYAGGIFNSIGGRFRFGLAKLDASGNGDADPLWNPQPNSMVTTLAVTSDDVIYAGGNFTMVGDQVRNGIVALPPDADLLFRNGFEASGAQRRP